MSKMDEATRKRVRAGRLMLAGKTPAEAAKAVGVVRQTAYTWKGRLDEGGIEALRAMVNGRPAQLDAKQLDALRAKARAPCHRAQRAGGAGVEEEDLARRPPPTVSNLSP